MSVYQEFLDQNLHRVYPLIDNAGGIDVSGTFRLPTSLISDIYLCAPNLSYVDKEKFYIRSILIRRLYITITVGYYDGAVIGDIGSFKGIRTDAAAHSTYEFVPVEKQTNDAYTPLYFMTGQIVIGNCVDALKYLGMWQFEPVDAEHSTLIVPTRIGKGLVNVQYLSINGRLLTGNIKLKEGTNIELAVDSQEVGGQTQTTVTVSASLTAGSGLQLNSDADIFDKLVDEYGTPIRSINGVLPNAARAFQIGASDCTRITGLDHGISISNPCAAPCCDQDANITAILESISNLNLRYAQLKTFFESSMDSINQLQNKLLVLGSNVG